MEKNESTGNFPAGSSLCPGCREKITPADVEMFPACPYCGRQFDNIKEVEDFAISRKIREWTIGHCARFLRDRR